MQLFQGTGIHSREPVTVTWDPQPALIISYR